jgi:hypothetical protein
MILPVVAATDDYPYKRGLRSLTAVNKMIFLVKGTRPPVQAFISLNAAIR